MPSKTKSPNGPVDVIVVGSGFAGLYALYRLRALGFSVRVLEAARDVGGTWYWNRYPGARCDVESLSYSYSFDEALQQQWRWSKRYAEQPEILAYINHVVERFDLRPDIVFDTKVSAARFDEQASCWRLHSDDGRTFAARYCIMATGSLSKPQYPDIDGMESFAGECHHTALWPLEGVSFAGKKVALIGTGATGAQATPVIANEAARLTVFQRTANFSVPAWNREISDAEDREWKANYAFWRNKERTTHTGFHNEGGHPSAAKLTPEQRLQTLESGWRQGGLLMWNVFSDLMTDASANELTCEFIRDKIRSIVKDPATAAALCPTTHPVGSKRLCVDSGYYQAFNRDNVELVDVNAWPIERFTRNGIVYGGCEAPFDAVVFATGFDAMTGTLLSIDIEGTGGARLSDEWRDGPQSFLGIAIAGFPNLFTITGPGSPSVLSHVLMSIEQHVDWISNLLVNMRERGTSVVEPNREAQADWVEHARAVAVGTLFLEADSWYTGANVPGKPRVFMPYVGGAHNYRARCNEIAAADYEGFSFL